MEKRKGVGGSFVTYHQKSNGGNYEDNFTSIE